jgi:predicted nucleic acid-binding protein
VPSRPPAAWAYFDTSALIKRYVEEPGRRAVLQLLRRHACVTSAVLPVEIQSALRRRVSDGTLDAAGLSVILKRVAADRAYWTLVEVAEEVLSAAESLAVAHPLRALDAIHLASAQVLAGRMAPTTIPFVSADVRQTAAASALGMTVRLIES